VRVCAFTYSCACECAVRACDVQFVADTLAAVIAGDYTHAYWSVLCLFVAGTVDAILDFWNFYLFGFAQQRLIRDLRLRLFSTILRQEVGYFDKFTTGYITSRLSGAHICRGDVVAFVQGDISWSCIADGCGGCVCPLCASGDTSEMANDLTFVIRWSIEASVRLIGIVVYLFYRNWSLAAVACSVIPVCAWINRRYGVWLHENAKKVQTALAEVLYSTNFHARQLPSRSIACESLSLCGGHACLRYGRDHGVLLLDWLSTVVRPIP
jgi:ABC-type multidrug transport system fused ATPase/permease subunit